MPGLHDHEHKLSTGEHLSVVYTCWGGPICQDDNQMPYSRVAVHGNGENALCKTEDSEILLNQSPKRTYL